MITEKQIAAWIQELDGDMRTRIWRKRYKLSHQEAVDIFHWLDNMGVTSVVKGRRVLLISVTKACRTVLGHPYQYEPEKEMRDPWWDLLERICHIAARDQDYHWLQHDLPLWMDRWGMDGEQIATEVRRLIDKTA